MAGDLEGDDYVALDAEIFGGRSSPGTTDDLTRPLSTYVENRIDGSSRFLARLSDTFQYSFFGVSGEMRKFAAARTHWFVQIPYLFHPADSDLEVKILGQLAADGSKDLSVRLYAHVLFPESGQQTDPSQMVRPAPTAGNRGVFEMTHSLTQTPDGRLRFGVIRVGISKDTVENVSLDVGWTRVGPYFYRDNATYAQWDNIDETQYWKTDQVIPLDIYHQIDPSGNEARGSIHRNSPYDAAKDKPQELDRVEIGYIRPEAISFQVQRSQSRVESAVSQMIPKSAPSMRAQTTVSGADTAEHGAMMDAIWRRRRCFATGPPGSTDGVDWPAGYHRRWSWVEGADTDSSILLDEQVGWSPQQGTTIECLLIYTLVREVSDDGAVGRWQTALQSDEDREDADSYFSFGNAQFEIALDQPGSGDTQWSSATAINSQTETVSGAQILPMTRVEWASLPNTIYWSRHPGGFNSVSSEFRWAFKEGMTRGGGADGAGVGGDVGVWKTARVATTVDDANVSDNPFRCRLIWQGFDGAVDDPDDDLDTEAYHLVVLGTQWAWAGVPE